MGAGVYVQRVILSSVTHVKGNVSEGSADTVLVASIFHFGEYTVPEAKAFMQKQDVEVRL